jgi:hypothetical protein
VRLSNIAALLTIANSDPYSNALGTKPSTCVGSFRLAWTGTHFCPCPGFHPSGFALDLRVTVMDHHVTACPATVRASSARPEELHL